MATVPSPITWVAGATVTAAQMNANVRDVGTFNLGPPSLFTYQNTAQAALTTAVSTLVTFDTNAYDTDSAHSTSTNTSRIVPQTAGFHLVVATCTFGSNATGIRWLDIRKNAAGSNVGGTRVSFTAVNATIGSTITVVQLTDVIQFNGTTDYIEMFAEQTSGGGLSLFAAATGGSWLSAVSIKTRWLNS